MNKPSYEGFQIFLGDKHEPGETMKAPQGRGDDSNAHMANFLKAMRNRKVEDLNGDDAEANKMKTRNPYRAPYIVS